MTKKQKAFLEAYYFATKEDNLGLELIDLFSAYICLEEMKDEM